jgi:hypothetical protein
MSVYLARRSILRRSPVCWRAALHRAALVQPFTSPTRRFAAAPVIPIAMQLCLKFISGPVGRAAGAAGLYMARWWPYYLVKFTAIKAIKSYGAPNVYRHVVRATSRLVNDRAERNRVRSAAKSLLRMPATVQGGAIRHLQQMDQFLLRWATEHNVGGTWSADRQSLVSSSCGYLQWMFVCFRLTLILCMVRKISFGQLHKSRHCIQ